MPPAPPVSFSSEDKNLFAIAAKLLSKHFSPGRHEVATAFLLDNGQVVTGLHVEGSAGRSSICAEGMAVGAALISSTPSPRIISVVAVLYIVSTGLIRPIAPCGLCRELLFDYCPDARCFTWLPAPTQQPLPSSSSPPYRKPGEIGFDLEKTRSAEGEVLQWKATDLMPGKTVRKGWET